MPQIFILIILITSSSSAYSGAGIEAVEFRSQVKCEQAKRTIENAYSRPKVKAYCVEK